MDLFPYIFVAVRRTAASLRSSRKSSSFSRPRAHSQRMSPGKTLTASDTLAPGSTPSSSVTWESPSSWRWARSPTTVASWNGSASQCAPPRTSAAAATTSGCLSRSLCTRRRPAPRAGSPNHVPGAPGLGSLHRCRRRHERDARPALRRDARVPPSPTPPSSTRIAQPSICIQPAAAVRLAALPARLASTLAIPTRLPRRAIASGPPAAAPRSVTRRARAAGWGTRSSRPTRCGTASSTAPPTPSPGSASPARTRGPWPCPTPSSASTPCRRRPAPPPRRRLALIA